MAEGRDVFDLWANRWRVHHARGQVIIVRYADDIVVGFEHEAEAKRFRTELQQRMEKFALSLHPQKTRRDRMRAKLREIKEALRRCMHDSIPEQGRWLAQVVRGYFNYHAVPTNSQSLSAFRNHVVDLWRRTLKRRSQKDPTTWARMARLAADFLPPARILHPWPQARFAVTHPRWEPGA